MTAISRSKTNIYIVNAGVAPSTLVATDIYKGDIKSYSKSGGETDVDSEAVFGGFIDKEKPTSQIEISLEIVPLLDGDKADRWDSMIYAIDVANPGSVIYTTASETSTQSSDKQVIIEASSGTEAYKTYAYNNCKVTVLDMEHNADDNRSYNMTLKFSPTTDDGVANLMTGKVKATALPAWTTLDNNPAT